MRSPKDMRIIEIDITNACVHKCSNCTRFCGHHQKPYFMDLEMFKRAIDSLEDFPKCIGIMGGEPTLHPQFEQIVKYIKNKRTPKYMLDPVVQPIKDITRYMRDRNYFLDESLNNHYGFGLLSSACHQYYANYEIIQDAFSYQLLNDHNNPSLHQPLLASRKELGIPDEEWIPMRDACWFQNMWSASITPKGAFFCEIAGTLDMLFDGPGGWKVEKNWWKREPEDFGDQLKWCEICGGAIFHCGRLSSEEVDDVSPMLYEKLKKIKSPKVRSGKCVVMDMKKPNELAPMPDTRDRYLTDYDKRVNKDNKSIYPRKIDAVILAFDGNQGKILSKYAEEFDRVLYVTSDRKEYEFLETTYDADEKIWIKYSEVADFGHQMVKAIRSSEEDWICYIKNENDFTWKEHLQNLRRLVINPGVLYRLQQNKDLYMFHNLSKALKIAGYDRINCCQSIEEMQNYWESIKRVTLDKNYQQLRNPDLKDWVQIGNSCDIQDKSGINKCLKKIISDYSE